ncbi:MAG: helix-turn-helix domain-containing protein [Candidatus Bipolaricaulota bacterium]|nr:helix-turn-helix domain-containing protein [Candidatus Bipolaricaulota bacterium]MCX7844667.1 helix-turn-helix domain-containing protein [Candidatus Bipolaricaulota bacterium]MDW8152535.1 helix-turn-helix transcriptional regulator [Candidatus Bipolaricaulota bacterium]
MEPLGKRLRDFRLERGLSKRALAKILGVSAPTLARWEEGEAEPHDYNRQKILRLLEEGARPPRP